MQAQGRINEDYQILRCGLGGESSDEGTEGSLQDCKVQSDDTAHS